MLLQNRPVNQIRPQRQFGEADSGCIRQCICHDRLSGSDSSYCVLARYLFAVPYLGQNRRSRLASHRGRLTCLSSAIAWSIPEIQRKLLQRVFRVHMLTYTFLI